MRLFRGKPCRAYRELPENVHGAARNNIPRDCLRCDTQSQDAQAETASRTLSKPPIRIASCSEHLEYAEQSFEWKPSSESSPRKALSLGSFCHSTGEHPTAWYQKSRSI